MTDAPTGQGNAASLYGRSAPAVRPLISSGVTSGQRHTSWLHGLLSDWDLLVLVVLMVADFRVFKGSSVASFTLYELFAWGYCAPYVIDRTLWSRRLFQPGHIRFAWSVSLYLGWLLLASLSAMLARQHTDVLQQAKNIVPALPLVCFIFVRVRQVGTVARIANIYVAYCVVTCGVALWQLTHGGPYFHVPLENDEYKLDFNGDVVARIVVGFSGTQNELALAMLPGAMFSATKLVQELREGRVPRLLTLACCAVTGVVLILAQSRGAVVCFIFGLLFMVFQTRFSRSFLLKFIAVATVIVVVVAYGLHAGGNDATGIDSTIQVRYLLWKTSMMAMASDPYITFLGDGIGYVVTWSWQVAGWEFPDAHNGWIDQALFFGCPAILLYLGIWRSFFGIVDAAAASGTLPAHAQVLLDAIRASVLALMALNFFEPVAHAVLPVSQLFLLMSCGVALASFPDRRAPERAPQASGGLRGKRD